jgi:hypothetical protein
MEQQKGVKRMILKERKMECFERRIKLPVR